MKRRRDWKLRLYAWYWDGMIPDWMLRKIQHSKRRRSE